VLKKNIKWSKEKILNRIKKIDRAGEWLAPTAVLKKHPKLFNAAVRNKYFGSWRNALSEAGFNPDEVYQKFRNNRKNKKWTKKRIISEIQEYKTADLFTIYKTNKKLYSAAYRTFGNWENALKNAKRLKEYQLYKQKNLIKKIKNYYNEHGKDNIVKNNKKLYNQVYRIYGSWEEGLIAAGVLNEK